MLLLLICVIISLWNSALSQNTSNLVSTSITFDVGDVACSANCQNVVTVGYGGYIFTSDNFGCTWANTSAPYERWQGVASSSSGLYIYAIVNGGVIYQSKNSGITWTKSFTTVSSWSSIATSSSGQYAFAASSTGGVYYTASYGSSWTSSLSVTNAAWSIACSSSGQYVTVLASYGTIYYSTNHGVLFTQYSSLIKDWSSVAINGSGEFQAAAAFDGSIYISTTYGSQWTATNSLNLEWNSLSMSTSGQYIYAAVHNGTIYSSDDYGGTWVVSLSPNEEYFAIVTGSDGQYVFAGAREGLFSNNYNCSYPTQRPSVQPTSFPTGYVEYSYKLVEVDSTVVPYYMLDSSSSGQYLYSQVNSNMGFYMSSNFGQGWSFVNNSITAYEMVCSSSGQIVYTYNDFVYLSTNYGKTWSTTNAPSEIYDSVATNGDGQTVFVGDDSGVVHYSYDTGNTWSSSDVSSFEMYSVACSDSSQYVLAVDSNGNIYVSNSHGVNYTRNAVVKTMSSFHGVVSYSGMYQAVAYGNYNSGAGGVTISRDYGVTWETVGSLPTKYYSFITMDQTGQMIFVCVYGGYIYMSSNYGNSWTTVDAPSNYWEGITVSANGGLLAAVVYLGQGGFYTNEFVQPSSSPTSMPTQPTSTPTSMPSCQPSTVPFSQPSSQPTSFPSYIPDTYFKTANVYSTDATTSTEFSNIGCDSTVFVSVAILVSYLDAQSDGAIAVVAQSGLSQSLTIVDACAPQELCGEVSCVVNFDVSSVVSCNDGGSLILTASTVNASQQTGVDTRCTYEGNSGLQFALAYSVSVYPLPTQQPTHSPTVAKNPGLVFQASPDAPFYVIVFLTFLCTALGVFIVRLRDKTARFTKIEMTSTCVDLAIIGYHISSEIFYIVVLCDQRLWTLAAIIITIRLLSIVPSVYFIVLCFGPDEYSKVYSKLLVKSHLLENTTLYAMLAMLMMVEQSLVRYLPWNGREFIQLSRGFPDRHVFKVCFLSKFVQLLGSLIVQLVVLFHAHSELFKKGANKIDLALVLLYLISSVATMTLFAVTNGVRLKVSESDEEDKKDLSDSVEITNPISDGGAMVEMSELKRSDVPAAASAAPPTQYLERIAYLEERETLLTSKLTKMEAVLQKLTGESSAA